MKPNLKSQIILMSVAGKKPKEIADALKIPRQTVYDFKYAAKKRAKNKRIPRTITIKPSTPLRPERQLVSKVLLEDKVEALQIEITNLKHQIIGFRAVISYLEDLAGVRNSQ